MAETYFVKRDVCPGCTSADSKVVYTCGFLQSPIKEYLESFYFSQGGIDFEYLKDGEFILNECSHCGLIYQKEIPNDILMKELYEKWTRSQTTEEPGAQKETLYNASLRAQEIMMMIAYLSAGSSPLKFFDFGMGWGKWCLMAKAFGCDVYGTDLSMPKIEHAKSLGIQVITWNDIPNHAFDFINTEQVFEHLPEPLETLRYLKTSLKPEGLIKISVPDGGNIKSKLKISDWTAPKYSKNSLNAVSPLEHINCYNRASIITMANKAGLELVKIPLTIQYAYASNWKPIKPALKTILRPLYRDVFQKGTSLFFRQKKSSQEIR